MVQGQRRRTDDDAPNAEAPEVLRVTKLAQRIAKTAAEDHLETPLERGFLDVSRQSAVKGIGDRWDKEPEHWHKTSFKLSRRPGWPVSQPVDHLPMRRTVSGAIRCGRPFK